MKVYLVGRWSYDECYFYGVFSTVEKARAHRKDPAEDSILEFTIDEPCEGKNVEDPQVLVYVARLDADGSVTTNEELIRQSWVDDFGGDSGRCTFRTGVGWNCKHGGATACRIEGHSVHSLEDALNAAREEWARRKPKVRDSLYWRLMEQAWHNLGRGTRRAVLDRWVREQPEWEEHERMCRSAR